MLRSLNFPFVKQNSDVKIFPEKDKWRESLSVINKTFSQVCFHSFPISFQVSFKGTDPLETDQDLNSTIETRGMFWLVLIVLALQVLFTSYLAWIL